MKIMGEEAKQCTNGKDLGIGIFCGHSQQFHNLPTNNSCACLSPTSAFVSKMCVCLAKIWFCPPALRDAGGKKKLQAFYCRSDSVTSIPSSIRSLLSAQTGTPRRKILCT